MCINFKHFRVIVANPSLKGMNHYPYTCLSFVNKNCQNREVVPNKVKLVMDLTWHLDRTQTRVAQTHPGDGDPGSTNHESSSQSYP